MDKSFSLRSSYRRRIWVVACVACLLCAIVAPALCACAASQVRTVYGLGAVLKLVCYEGMNGWYAYAKELVTSTQSKVDCDDPNSDVARFNAAKAGEWVTVGECVYEMVQLSRQAYDLTEGAYDPTAYWLVDLWGFSARAQNGAYARPYDRSDYALPSDEYIEAFASLCNLGAVECRKEGDAYALCKTKSVTIEGVEYTVALDLGGIAKGWVVRCLTEYAAQNGITKGYASFGTSSVGLLANREGKDWELSLRHPRSDEGRVFCTTPQSNVSVATSGDYENYYLWQGKRYCHLIDPRTGRPIDNGVHSVTVLGQDSALVDALATGLAIRGIDYIISFADSEACRTLGLQLVAVYGEEGALQCFSTLPSLQTSL